MRTITRLDKTFHKHKISIRHVYKTDFRKLRILDNPLGDKAHNLIQYIRSFNNLLKKSNTLDSNMIREIRSISYYLRNTHADFEDRISILEKYNGLNSTQNKKIYDSINRIRFCITDFKENPVVNIVFE
jgi:hypothetical protein